ncbi:phosphatidylglycerophosphatase A [Candidatus Kinetoplastibacterium desouzaii TCC079E]|uniref:Phosphatidylglycerophosphatase A n=1 Tax=Candidatus Kinetoplastidibacterium desouzai TCC079E TaxID=1208919 RepID=M1LM84_9PROT|nr:phosphatidylglycerophosphatase A [Candidatus Kinetoplastibacterium desouzaii]AGF46832.1 phosphatidylglycerophosphatase A [Candidatus Kinetoplastibacterium desouzaii TCC079E]
MQYRRDVYFPNFSWICKKPVRFLAFGCGSGLIRPASGTWGTLFAWLLWHFFLKNFNDIAVVSFLVSGFIYGCFACNYMEIELNTHDHVGIVWDEIIAFILILWVFDSSFLIQGISFVFFRFFDIIKPPPIGYIDRVFKNGFGVMLDDILAAIYTIMLVLLITNYIK